MLTKTNFISTEAINTNNVLPTNYSTIETFITIKGPIVVRTILKIERSLHFIQICRHTLKTFFHGYIHKRYYGIRRGFMIITFFDA